MRKLAFAAAVLAILEGCPESGPSGDGGVGLGRGSVMIENQTQYLLTEIRIHEAASHLNAPNRLALPMEIGGELLFHGIGEYYVTVFREKHTLGPLIAFTTATPIDIAPGSGYRLLVFDQAFRLLDDELDPPRRRPASTKEPRRRTGRCHRGRSRLERRGLTKMGSHLGKIGAATMDESEQRPLQAA